MRCITEHQNEMPVTCVSIPTCTLHMYIINMYTYKGDALVDAEQPTGNGNWETRSEV